MNTRIGSIAGMVALAGALVLLCPGKSEAQRRGFYGGFGGYPGYGYGGYGGWGNPGSSGWGYGGYGGLGGFGVGGYGSGMGNYLGNVSGYGYLNSPYYNYLGYGYAPGIYGSSSSPPYNYLGYGYASGIYGSSSSPISNYTHYSPESYSHNFAPTFYYGGTYTSPPSYAYNSPTNAYLSYYPATSGQQLGNSAEIRVTVAPDAEIWFDGTRTKQTGSVREFITPPLTPAHTYTYQVRAHWTQNGKAMDQTRTVTVQPGRHSLVDFTIPQK